MTKSTSLQSDLIHWFEREAESLPWREAPSPYHVWVSEIMLQQTQVATVIPYYGRFIGRFPDVKTLAKSPLDDVLKLWEGLGYYSRARNLHKAAKMVVDEHVGELPSNLKALQALPGIGRYTAGAILSFAFEERAPIVDGNIIRVFTRLFDIPDDVTKTAVKNALWERAESLLPDEGHHLWNEGLMELGRLVCLKVNPRCGACPIAGHCQANVRGTKAERPVKPSKKKTPHVDVTAAVIQREDGRYLITQRPTDKMLGGLWEFPGGKVEAGESLAECLEREIREELGMTIRAGEEILRVKHAYTHFRITLHVLLSEIIGGEPEAIECVDFRWATLEDISDFAFPVTDQKIITYLRERESGLLLL